MIEIDGVTRRNSILWCELLHQVQVPSSGSSPAVVGMEDEDPRIHLEVKGMTVEVHSLLEE